MTAEIAILNKSAVALAADSAVTIGRPPNAKIYNTVNKIFELSASAPVGIMVYGRLDFMGLPFETLIKQYRKKLRVTQFPKISDYCADFRSYLLADVPIPQPEKDKNAAIVINSHFQKANTEFDRLVREDIAKRGSFRRSKLNGILQTMVRAKIALERAKPMGVGFPRIALPAHLLGLVDVLAENAFQNMSLADTSTKLLRQWAGYFLSKQTLSDSRSGIVIAGFGENEWCPSLSAFETDGVIDGKLKYVERAPLDIGRHGPEADILGFAQDDMMKSFLEGVDPTIKQYLFTLAGQGIVDTAKAVLKAALNDDVKEAAVLAAMTATLTQMQEDARKKALQYIENGSAKPIRDMISAMPKQELAKLAESLIELTSLKRKVTRGQETVGGEVDVAIISKSEGFVWTKRKHYFPPDLNPRFFERHFNT